MKNFALILSVLLVAVLALPAHADPENQGRVKVKIDNPRSQSTMDDLQSIVVLCAKDDNSCQPKASGNAVKTGNTSITANPTKKTRQHNQSDVDFIRERAN